MHNLLASSIDVEHKGLHRKSSQKIIFEMAIDDFKKNSSFVMTFYSALEMTFNSFEIALRKHHFRKISQLHNLLDVIITEESFFLPGIYHHPEWNEIWRPEFPDLNYLRKWWIFKIRWAWNNYALRFKKNNNQVSYCSETCESKSVSFWFNLN